MDNLKHSTYIKILQEELIPAMGCTEPIAVSYISSFARDLLGKDPDKVVIEVSGNVLKNVKSVIVPNTEKMRGIPAACAAGIVCGKTDKKLEVISEINNEGIKLIKDLLDKNIIEVKLAESEYIFDLCITIYNGIEYAKVRMVNYHTNIVYAEKNGKIIFNNNIDEIKEDVCDKSLLNIEDIVDFAKEVQIEDIKEIFDKQISFNMAIAEEGIKGDYGANIGSVILKTYGDDTKFKMKAMASAASDARMNGCELPVIIVSGSGNQGITASVPVITYAKDKGFSQEDLYRALVVSNLVTIHQKSGIGRLSAFCGVVSAGIGSGAGIAFLETRDYKVIAHTIVNALGIVSGIVCDGAKASCAAKINSSVDAGILGYNMYIENQQFLDGEGLIGKGVENTINNISRLAKEGMKETDKEIIKMMITSC